MKSEQEEEEEAEAQPLIDFEMRWAVGVLRTVAHTSFFFSFAIFIEWNLYNINRIRMQPIHYH